MKRDLESYYSPVKKLLDETATLYKTEFFRIDENISKYIVTIVFGSKVRVLRISINDELVEYTIGLKEMSLSNVLEDISLDAKYYENL